MLRYQCVAGVLCLCASSTFAQECALPGPAYATVPCAPRTAAPASTSAPAPAEQGRFIRGPAAGTATGESNTIGLRGLVIHIPELRLQLPHIEMPGLYRVRHDASKIFDTTRSPLVEEAALEFDNVASPAPVQTAPAQTMPARSVPCYVPSYVPSCTPPTQCTEAEQQLKAMQAQMARLELLEKELMVLRQQQALAEMQQQMGRPVPQQPVQTTALDRRPPGPWGKPVYQSASYEEAAEFDVPRGPSPAKRPVASPQEQPAAQKYWIRDPNTFGEWTGDNAGRSRIFTSAGSPFGIEP